MGDPTEALLPPSSPLDHSYTLDPTFYPTYEPKPRLELLDKELRLDPDLELRIAILQAHLACEDVLARLLRPNWKLLEPTWGVFLARPDPVAMGLLLPAVQKKSYTPGKGPDKPRPADISDLLDAIYKMQQVQSLVQKVRDHGLRELRLLETEWRNAKVPEKITMVSLGTLVVGSMVGTILAAKPTRDLTLKFLDGRDIPTPVDGLSVKLLVPDDEKKRGWGGGMTAPLGVTGLSAGASLQARDGSAPDINVNITFDIAKYWRSRQKAQRSGK